MIHQCASRAHRIAPGTQNSPGTTIRGRAGEVLEQATKKAQQGYAVDARGPNTGQEPMGLTPLTAKQQFFVDEYLIDLNATQAAIRAGYSKKTARFIGCENLTKPNIAAAIAKKKAERSARVELEADRVLYQLKAIATSNIRDYLSYGSNGVVLKDSRGLTEAQSAAIEKVTAIVGSKSRNTVGFKLHNKLKAIGMALKHLWPHAAGKRENSFTDKADAAIREAIQDIMNGRF